VFLVAGDARILYANERAEALLAAGAHVISKAGSLTAANPAMAAPMADTIRRCVAPDVASDAGLGSRGIGIPVSTKPADVADNAGTPVRPHVTSAMAYVLPLTNGTVRSALHPAAAAVFISTAASAEPAVEAVVATLYGLTPTEARVLLIIGSGKTVHQVAAQLGIAENTVKTHLSRIFNKTGASRQTELVALVHGLQSPISLT
jgi:DNA-binding CsgD family transcriptional regulator